MAASYIQPPKVKVKNLIAGAEFLTAPGDITMKDDHGKEAHYSFCDTWRFREGKIVGLKAFVIKSGSDLLETIS
jgi:hypothetical protein